MQWILIIAVILVAILVLLRRKNKRPTITTLTDGQLDSMSGQVRSQIDRMDNKREENVSDDVAHQGNTLPLSVIIDRLERYKLENDDNEVIAKDIDRRIAYLKKNYSKEIPVEAVYDIAKEVMM